MRWVSAPGSTRAASLPGCTPTRSATLVAGRDAIGAVGEVAPDVLATLGIDERVAVLELDLRPLLEQEPRPARWKPTSRFPSSDLDLAFVLPEDVPAERLDKAIRQGAGPLLVDLELFDVYRGSCHRRGAAQPGVPPPPPGAGPQPDRRRRRRGPRRGHAAAAKLGAELRG